MSEVGRDGAGPARGRRRRLLGAWIRGGPLWCSWQLTRRCSSLCLFCENRPLAAEEEVDTAGCRRIAGQLGRIGPLFVSLSGGEPFLRADLPEIVAAVAQQNVPLLTTHGWLLEAERAREVWAAGLEAATVLLEHPGAEAHDQRLGVKGAHARALTSLGVLADTRTSDRQRVNLKVRVRETQDVEGLASLAAAAAAHGASLTVEPGYPVATGCDAGLAPALIALKKAQPALRSSRAYLERFDEARGAGVPGCRAGRTFLNVDHRGRVTQCVEYGAPEHQVGELVTEDVGHVLQKLKEHTATNTCRRCWSASRGEMEVLYSWRGVSDGLATLWRR